jgi:hypothetical protein
MPKIPEGPWAKYWKYLVSVLSDRASRCRYGCSTGIGVEKGIAHLKHVRVCGPLTYGLAQKVHWYWHSLTNFAIDLNLSSCLDNEFLLPIPLF